MDNGEILQINLTQILPCQLQCKFCLNDKSKIPVDKFDFETFKTTVEICINHGIYNFNLTPHIGDFLLDEDFEKKCIFLELHPEVESWEFVTNFISLSGRKFLLLPFKKGNVCISIYGTNRKDFLYVTNKDKFKKFWWNLQYIINNAKDLNIVTIYTRYNKSLLDNKVFNNTINRLKKLGAKEDNTEILNKNWAGFLPSNYLGKKKNGICQHTICDNGIFPDGSMTLCNCWDTFKSLCIGNVFDEGLENIYSENSKFGELIKGQMFGKYVGICKKCNDFELVDINEIEIDWLKKHKKIIKQTRKQR